MELSFTQSPDATKIRLGKTGTGNRNILIIPGLAEHLGRYEYLAQQLAKSNFNVTVMEPRGHGESDGNRGHVHYWNQYSEDVSAAATTIDGPMVLLGHSTGGLISLFIYLHGLKNGIIGLALSAPNVFDTVDAPVKKFIGKILSRIYPTLALSTGLNTKHLSRDPEIVKKYEEDPLVFGVVTTRFYTEMLNAQQRVRDSAPQGDIPLLLQVGEEDKIVDSKSSIEMAKSWKKPAKIITYPNLYHEIFNEPEKDKVIADLVEWLNDVFSNQ